MGSDVRATALAVIAEVGGVELAKLEPDTELVAHLGIDSPRALQLLVELEERLGIEIEDEEIGGLQTVGDVLVALERHRAAGT